MSPPVKFKDHTYYLDYWLMFLAFGLLAIGLLLLASASMGISDRQFHHPFHFLYRQIVFLVGGLGIGLFVLQIPLNFWEKIGGYLLLTSMVLLILVLVPGVGREVNGSVRWINLGPLALQVSEFAKFAIMIYTAGYILRRQDEVRASIKGFIKPLMLVGVIATLLLLEPDFGAVVVITLTVLGMMYLSGARLWQFIVLFFVSRCLALDGSYFISISFDAYDSFSQSLG